MKYNNLWLENCNNNVVRVHDCMLNKLETALKLVLI